MYIYFEFFMKLGFYFFLMLRKLLSLCIIYVKVDSLFMFLILEVKLRLCCSVFVCLDMMVNRFFFWIGLVGVRIRRIYVDK